MNTSNERKKNSTKVEIIAFSKQKANQFLLEPNQNETIWQIGKENSEKKI